MGNEILKTIKVLLTCESLLHDEDNAIEVKVRINKNYFKHFINARLTYLRKPQADLQQKLKINELTVQIVIHKYNKHPDVSITALLRIIMPRKESSIQNLPLSVI